MNEIKAALAALETKGDYYTEHKLDASYLQVNVNKVGRLNYPLTDITAKSLIQIAEPAKYGLKEQTLLDTSVRKVWEIKPSKFKILKTGWRQGIKPMLDQMRKDLGLPDETKLVADVHNLLVYEPGCFFKPHQDSEKVDNMVATMVIVLPSTHVGGALIVEHNGRQYVFDSGKDNTSLQAFSFYADCRHEVRPLTSGYRVALTFNLILQNYQGETKNLIERDFDKRISVAIERYFSTKSWLPRWCQDDTNPVKFVYLLDHEYTQSGLSWQCLKNTDRVRVDALLKAADKHELDAYLTLVDSHEVWGCDDENDYYARSHYDEEFGDLEDNYVLHSLIDSDTAIEYWLDRDGNYKSFASYNVDNCFVHATKDGNAFVPYESEYEGFMGNYGNTMDRWYKRAALVMWKKADAQKILFEIDPLSYVEKLYKPMYDSVSIDTIKQALYSQVDELNDVWTSLVRQAKVPEHCAKVLEFSAYINDPVRASRIISHFDSLLIDARLAKQWVLLVNAYGADWVIEIFSELLDKRSTRRQEGLSDFCDLIKAFQGALMERPVMRFLFDYHVKIMASVFSKITTPRERFESQGKRYRFAKECIEGVLLLEDEALHQQLIDLLISGQLQLEPLELAELLLKYLRLDQNQHVPYGVDRLVNYVVLLLENEKSLGVKAQDDWSISADTSCGCDLCDELVKFLSDVTWQEKTWPIAKEKRRHVGGVIYQANIPVSTKEVATGSPHKLVLTKDQDMHSIANKRYQAVCDMLVQLRLGFNLDMAVN
ncbi:2OG-Fe(II) oxygenase [Facilibium subflavum]|uniref:2OG-Fe(II) oxygenase n=1 Tax=Facilibium subflavum TaxID=2219058 RepID=UPI000E652DFD|nr:2OG-Fe(II) oxygenase [Facilibium subflavum]